MHEETFKALEILKQTALDNGIIEQYFDTHIHSAHVYNLARELANKIYFKTPCNINYGLLETMCIAHDTGRMVTGSKASKELKHAIYHGYEGARILKSSLFGEIIARCCETHMGGTGLTPETKEENNVKTVFKDTNDISIEEKIVGYADLLTFAKENNSPSMPYLPYRASLKEAYERVKGFGDVYAERLDKLIDELFCKATLSKRDGMALDEIDYNLIPAGKKPNVYDFKTKKCADILRAHAVNHVKSKREDTILIKEFTSGNCYGRDGENNWKLELKPLGLCEHLHYISYCFVADGEPDTEYTRDECVSLDQFEEIVEKYSLNANYINKKFLEEK